MKTVWIRHGQSEYNAKNLATGWHDPNLTQLGIEQALNTASILGKKYTVIDSIHTSDLRRAAHTANLVLENTPWFVDIQYDSRLRERDYGDWSGKDKDENRKSVGDEQFLAIRRGWDIAPPNGESLKDTCRRVADYLDSIPQADLPIIFVCHGNTIRAASIIFKQNTTESVVNWEIETGGFVEWDY
jgi:2,3-bisphosphoglycerate-dependent phosphoglycerate mutase